MARTRSISDEQILNAALEVFLARGFQATSAEIAKCAGISEGTIFRRFSTKDELFFAAMLQFQPEWIEKLEEIEASGDLEEDLLKIGEAMLGFFVDMLPQIHTLASSGDRFREMLRRSPDSPPVRCLRILTRFFYKEQKAGRIGPGDPEIIARNFVGIMRHYADAEHIGINDWMPMPRPTFLRSSVRFFLRGVGAP